MSFFEDINIKYIDNKYIYLPALVYAIVNSAAVYVLDQPWFMVFSLSTLLLIVLLTVFHLYRSVVIELEEERRQNQALIAIHNMLDLAYPLPSMTKWAAKPDLAVTVMEYIQLLKPEFILEAGSGVTTLVSAYTLQKNGNGKILSLDHDEFYGNKTNQQLKKHGLSDLASVTFAPVKKQSIEGKSWKWYSINNVAPQQKIDMLIVDGPPVKTQSNARYPALPLFYDQLNEKAVVILDDAGRDSESEILTLWKKKYPEFDVEYIPSKKGIAILTRGL